MISDAFQEQAALYALDALNGEEAGAFERELRTNEELQTLVRELRDAAAALALTSQAAAPPAGLKARVMQQIAAEAPTSAKATNVIRPPRSVFAQVIPWALAAGLMSFCGLLMIDRTKLQERLAQERAAREARLPILVALAPAEGAPANAQAVIAWDPSTQTGTIRMSNLPAAGAGRDYQLWAVDAAHKDPISAGVVRVDANGVTQVQFKPTEAARAVKAFAISLEREGGVPKKEGPILLVGSA